MVIEYIKMVHREYSRHPDKYKGYICDVMRNIEKYLISHLEFEEKEVFPLFSDILLINELIQEHKEFLRILNICSEEEGMIERTIALEELAGKLYEHLKKENTKILPLL